MEENFGRNFHAMPAGAQEQLMGFSGAKVLDVHLDADAEPAELKIPAGIDGDVSNGDISCVI